MTNKVEEQQDGMMNDDDDEELPSSDMQLNKIETIFKKYDKRKLNDLYIAIDFKWYDTWKRYVGWDKKEANERKQFVTNAQQQSSLKQSVVVPAAAASSSMEMNDMQIDTNEVNNTTDDNDINDEEEYEMISSPPGIIDNSDLLTENDNELSANVIEGLHYELIPEDCYNLLVKWYGVTSDRKIRRTMIKTNENDLIIELYPFLFFCYKCDPLTGEKLNVDDAKVSTTFSRKATMKQIKDDVCNLFNLNGNGFVENETRIWFSETQQTTNNNNDIKKEGKLEEWILVKKEYDSRELEQVWQAGLTSITIMIERKHCYDDVKIPIFPRDYHNELKWKLNLQVGDKIDAKDSDNEWFDSEVKEIRTDTSMNNNNNNNNNSNDKDKYLYSNKEVRIRFKGWSAKFDLWIPVTSDRIQKLWSKVENWRNFKINDLLEMKTETTTTTGSTKIMWHKATVEQIRNENDGKIMIYVKQNDSNSNSNTNKERWVDAQGEEIAKLYTHMKDDRRSNMRPSTTVSSSSGIKLGGSYNSNRNWNTGGDLYSRSNTQGTPPVKGAVGLNNIGNTCFMNSMLQCLSNTEILTTYFLKNEHIHEINTENPLGMKGDLVTHYAKLMHDMWSGKYTSCIPTALKFTIGKFNSQFAGFAQQDSQELMNFLLDGLHEDLNRIIKKPYVEKKDYDGRPDAIIAAEEWENHKKRNDSKIVDTCQGLLRSHLTCSLCGNISIKFDPYLSISLPIPVKATKKVEIIFYPLPVGTRPMKLIATLDIPSTVGDLQKWLLREITSQSESSTIIKNDPNKIVIADIMAHKTMRLLGPRVSIEQIRDNDVTCAYEIEYDRVEDHGDSCDILICNSTAISFTRSISYSYGSSKPRYQLNGKPFRTSYVGTTTCATIHEQIWRYVSRCLQPDEGNPSPYHFEKNSMDINLPYTIEVVSRDGTSKDCQVPNDETSFKQVLDHNQGWAICIVWKKEVVESNSIIDVDELEYEDTSHHSYVSGKMKKEVKQLSINDCIKSFITEEQLSQQDLWRCDKCKQENQALKKMDIWSVPDVLILHLKRFQYRQSHIHQIRSKIEDLVSFPIEGLDLGEYVMSEQTTRDGVVYDLFGVSEHSGGLGMGHYTAIAQNFLNNEWYNFNDSSVSRTQPDRCISTKAYVLFYKRRKQNQV